MLDRDTKTELAEALRALADAENGPWQALGPLSRVAAQGTDITIDYSTSETLGTPVLIARPRPKTALPGLTPRQTQVLGAIMHGRSNKEIARELEISPATVKDHVHALLQRLGLKSRAELIAYVHRVNANPGAGY